MDKRYQQGLSAAEIRFQLKGWSQAQKHLKESRDCITAAQFASVIPVISKCCTGAGILARQVVEESNTGGFEVCRWHWSLTGMRCIIQYKYRWFRSIQHWKCGKDLILIIL
ncbi:hypothetical protein BT96DRAFT_684544 [Gymnopus androsaceus JB14]|uniref:Uncharacterized protein n=1 Tax=Gymnopus androsaceus JB14 TaxID=1447944 RepID=A0A6A4HQH1_9AGAR|nr:hypothetical protein BT96DRAFT_684544 [Gymnopus androsaceus JB14]